MSFPPNIDAAPILECRHLSVCYDSRAGSVPAVVDFNLTLERGEAHGLVGESGCGKSTIALAIMRHLGRSGRIAGGQILFQGRDILAMSAEELRRTRGAAIAMVYQEPMASLNPSMTVGEQLVEVPMFHDGCTRPEAQTRARTMLERVHMTDGERIMRAYPHQISGGQQQRIVIAMALLSHPRLLLLDEPTTALDVTVEAGIVDLIREISAELGTSMLYISHNLGLVRAICDRITVMYAGEAVEVGVVSRVFGAMRHPYTLGLIASMPVPTADKTSRRLEPIPGQPPTPRDRPPGCGFGPRCAYFVPGRCDQETVPLRDLGGTEGEGLRGDHDLAAHDLAAHDLALRLHASRCLRIAEIPWNAPPMSTPAPASPPAGEVVLAVEHLVKRYHKVQANDALTFDARRGETVAIVGESGCGKSTLARILMGLTPATSGSVRFRSLELSRLPVTRRSTKTLRGLQMIFQNPFDTLNPSHTVGWQIARVIRKFGVEREEPRVGARVRELLDLVRLPHEIAGRRPRQLSGGQKQRIGVARAFAGNPALVVADEPVSALDVSIQATILELFAELRAELGVGLLLISHNLAVVRALCDQVAVMYRGQIVELGSREHIFSAPQHSYTQTLLNAVPRLGGETEPMNSGGQQ